MAHLEEGNRRKDGTLSSRLHRQGHKASGAVGACQPIHVSPEHTEHTVCGRAMRAAGCGVLSGVCCSTVCNNTSEHTQHMHNVVQLCSTPHVQGILTTNLSAPVEGASTVSETYRQPEGAQARCVGSRREALLQQLHAMVSREVEEELTPTPPTADYRSTTKKDFFQGDKLCV